MSKTSLPKDENRFYCYGLLREDDAKSFPGMPFYVGKGCGDRYKGHLNPKNMDCSAKANVVRRIRRAGRLVEVVIYASGLGEKEAFEKEISLIASFGRVDKGTGCLHNKTDGGEGVSGHIRSGEWIEAHAKRMKEWWNGPGRRDAVGERMREFQNRPNVKEATSARAKAVWADPEFREAQIIRITAAQNIPEVVEAKRQRAIVQMNRPEVREENSRRTAEFQNRPEVKEANRQRGVERMNSPEEKDENRSRTTALWQDENYRARQTESHKAQWTDESFRELKAQQATEFQNRPEVRAENSRRTAERTGTQEWKDAHSAAMKVYYQDPDNLEANRERQKIAQNRPEVKIARSASMSAWHESPEGLAHKEKRSAAKLNPSEVKERRNAKRRLQRADPTYKENERLRDKASEEKRKLDRQMIPAEDKAPQSEAADAMRGAA